MAAMSDMISVAMAVYNGGKYLKQQIDSILSQIRDEDELVISYDASEDDTLIIIRDYEQKDRRVKVFNDPGHGVIDNFNNAITNSSGDYIFLSDQDDVWLEGKIERLLRCFREESPDLIIHNGLNTDENLEPVSGAFFDIYRIGDGKLKNIIKSRYSGCCMAFTKEMKNAILPIPVAAGYDRWIATVCEFLGKISYVDDVLIMHRLHDSNVTPEGHFPITEIIRMRADLVWNLILRIRRERRKG